MLALLCVLTGERDTVNVKVNIRVNLNRWIMSASTDEQKVLRGRLILLLFSKDLWTIIKMLNTLRP